MQGCTLYSNQAYNGGSLRLDIGTASHAHVLNCTFQHGKALIQGGAVCATVNASSDLLIKNSSFIDNTAALGGGIYGNVASGGRLMLHACNALGNQASNLGGGVCFKTECGGLATTDGGIVAGNTASLGGGLAMTSLDSSCSTPVLVTSGITLMDNSASNLGGGIYIGPYASVQLISTTLLRNVAQVSGGGMAAVGCSLLNMSGGSMSAGRANVSGGALFTQGCARTLLSGTMVGGNTAGSGGGVFLSGASGSADSADIAGSSAPGSAGGSSMAILHSVTLLNNSAIYSTSGAVSRYTGHGGGLFADGDIAVALSQCNIAASNLAAAGAALSSMQTCAACTPSPSLPPQVTLEAQGEALEWSAAWIGMQRAADQRCWVLALTNTSLPLPGQSTRSATASRRRLDAALGASTLTPTSPAGVMQAASEVWLRVGKGDEST